MVIPHRDPVHVRFLCDPSIQSRGLIYIALLTKVEMYVFSAQLPAVIVDCSPDPADNQYAPRRCIPICTGGERPGVCLILYCQRAF